MKQSLTVTGDLGDDVEKLADFNGKTFYIITYNLTTYTHTDTHTHFWLEGEKNEEMIRFTKNEKYEATTIKRKKTQKRN